MGLLTVRRIRKCRKSLFMSQRKLIPNKRHNQNEEHELNGELRVNEEHKLNERLNKNEEHDITSQICHD